MLNANKNLYDLGFALHLLKPKSKRPLENNWTKGPRKTWEQLTSGYRSGMNIGVRLGTASNIEDRYLAVIDCDVKSDSEQAQKELDRELIKHFGGDILVNPIVLSGRGNGSKHIYVLTGKAIKPCRIAQSSKTVKVKIPSVKANKTEIESLTATEIKSGVRLRAAWEISVMSEGQQVVIPPSVHPDTGREYMWQGDNFTFREFDLGGVDSNAQSSTTAVNICKFTPVDIDLQLTDLDSDTIAMVVDGEGVDDRSAALLSVCNRMIAAGLTEDEILSVLTDKSYYLGQTAYDHIGGDNRGRAAQWVRKYTLEKSLNEKSAARIFNDNVVEEPNLEGEGLKEQIEKAIPTPSNWKALIERTGKDGNGPPKVSYKNIILILRNAVKKGSMRRDLFAVRDAYQFDTPWGSKADEVITDDDILKIKNWLVHNHRMEPSVSIIHEAVNTVILENSFDSAREFLNKLPKWDEVTTPKGWLQKYFEAKGPDEYINQAFEKMLVALVTRIHEPGYKFDWCIILEGAQGIGKSSFGKMLVGDKFFLDWLPTLDDKEAALSLQGYLVVELGELSSLNKNEIETTKAFLSRCVDKVRPPYGRKSIESQRRCIFIGTTNKEEYLKDTNGNRRFVPIKVGQLNFEALMRDREQLLAYAVYAYKHKIHRILELENDAAVHQRLIGEEKMVEDDSVLMVERIEDFIEKETETNKPERFPFHHFCMQDLFDVTGPLASYQYNMGNARSAGKAIRKLGGEKKIVGHKKIWEIKNIKTP